MKNPNISRTGVRLQRLAFELEYVAGRLRDAGKDREAEGVRRCASQLGEIGRNLYLAMAAR